jgi:hypothetical protein
MQAITTYSKYASIYSFNVQLLQESCMERTVLQCVIETAMELGYSSMKP